METAKTIFAIIGALCSLSALLLFGYILINVKNRGTHMKVKGLK